MASITDIYIKKEMIETILNVLSKKNQSGINITISIHEDTNEFGNNVSAYVSQSKEERESKKDKFYIGNGRVKWTDGKILKAEIKENKFQVDKKINNEKLPF